MFEGAEEEEVKPPIVKMVPKMKPGAPLSQAQAQMAAIEAQRHMRNNFLRKQTVHDEEEDLNSEDSEEEDEEPNEYESDEDLSDDNAAVEENPEHSSTTKASGSNQVDELDELA